LRNNSRLIQGVCLNNLTGHTNYVFALTLLPNGLLISGSLDTKILIWDITKTAPLYTLTGHTNTIRALVVINQEYLASGAQDNMIKLWSLTSNYTQVRSWTASTSYITSLAFDSTLNVLASGDGNMNNNVKLWDSSLWANSGKLSHFRTNLT
jgi:WD40 repeat protein